MQIGFTNRQRAVFTKGSSFMRNSQGFPSLLVNPKETRLTNIQSILKAKQYKCKVRVFLIGGKLESTLYEFFLQFLIVWKSPSPVWHSSFAIQKGSPYGLFMRNVIYRMTENGQINWMSSRFRQKVKPHDCKTGLAKGNTLGLKKLSFPFVVALFGLLLSGLTCMCEIFFWGTPKLDYETQINEAKDALQNDIEHLKSVLRRANNSMEWAWLDETLVKIQNSHYDQ
jgi:hypothetical protein